MAYKYYFNDKTNNYEIVIELDTKPCAKLLDELDNLLNPMKDLIAFDKTGTSYVLKLSEIIFFETEDAIVFAHTITSHYQVNEKLYQLEDILPSNYIRISKSAIINNDYIHTIGKAIYSSRKVSFYNCSKVVFVSRHYYSNLKQNILRRTI